MVASPFETLFEGADGRYYTGWQIGRRLRTGVWALCIRQRTPDRLLVEAADEALLLLTSIEPDELPAGVEIRVSDGRPRVVDTRGRPSAPTPIDSRTDIDRRDPAPEDW